MREASAGGAVVGLQVGRWRGGVAGQEGGERGVLPGAAGRASGGSWVMLGGREGMTLQAVGAGGGAGWRWCGRWGGR